MRIGLMRYIPDETVVWSIKDVVKGDGEFNDAE